ncbi:hypothetical protein PT974_02206 [Cladobotryum mycophilum]|uniref:Uncharacterized protein n=1 Tax=Cladobotryum mycophilum TaxID=491253 RepID=A0ABR0SYR7_9HYPO
MAITEEFGGVPWTFYSPDSPTIEIETDMQSGGFNTFATTLLTHHQTPMVVVLLRTIYTEESDTTFPVAIKALEQRMKQYYLHMNRFSYWGQRGEEKKKTDGSANEEVARRFRIEVFEDKDRLNFPSLAGASHSTIKSLVDYFNEWVKSVGGDPTDQYPVNPRLSGCLAVDSGALQSLLDMSKEEIPPLRVAVDTQEKMEWRDQIYAWVWFLDARDFGSYRGGEQEIEFRGWGKLDASDIPDCWFRKSHRTDKEGWMFAEKYLDEHGDFFYG